jgi:hypothetical protein
MPGQFNKEEEEEEKTKDVNIEPTRLGSTRYRLIVPKNLKNISDIQKPVCMYSKLVIAYVIWVKKLMLLVNA